MVLTRPLGNSIRRPLAAGALWAAITATATVLIATLTGGIGWLVTWVMSWFDSTAPGVPWDLVRGVGAALAPFVLGAATWAATYGSAERHHLVRALAGTAAGVVVLAVLVRLDNPAAAFGALGISWVPSVPFERWSRAGARLVLPLAGSIAGFFVPEPGIWWLVVIVAASIPAAAVAVGIGDLGWRLVRSEPEHGEAGKPRDQDRPF